jgi:hypothetical protein
MRIRYKDIPIIKKKLLKKQKNMCPICHRDLSLLKSRDVCLDHNHKNGRIRSVLCRGCNSLEGKYQRAFTRVGHKNQGVNYKAFLQGLIEYVDYKETKYIHPKYKGK